MINRMKIISNSNIPKQQAENYILGELSNVSMVVQSNQVLTEYYSINADMSTLVGGFKNVDNYISKDSTVVYDKIDNLPMCGIDNLAMVNEYSDETGYDVEFDGSAMIFPNTVVPKPGDCFLLKHAKKDAVYVVTDTKSTVVRSNPFVEISFMLYSQDPEDIVQLRKQVKNVYVVSLTSLGNDRTLVIEQTKFFTIEKHIRNYLEVCDMYISLFYDYRKSMFVYDELYDSSKKMNYRFIDIPMWKFMYDNEIIVYDNMITYAINNLNIDIDRIYVDDPSKYIDRFEYRKTPLFRLLERNSKRVFTEYCKPVFSIFDDKVSKFDGVNVYYIERYNDEEEECIIEELRPMSWLDDEFIDRITNNIPYDMEDDELNIHLRNSIIAYYNGEKVDFENIILHDDKSVENFYLIPLLLAIYKQYITNIEA